MKWFRIFLLIVFLQSCASVSFVKKHQLHVDGLKALTVEIYQINKGIKILKEKTDYIFTKNGRVKFSMTYDENNKLVSTEEKKLWFVKQSFPDKEPYYCKTRWKPNHRERISCYTQKQYKQNEAIYYYNANGSIHKIEDNFTTFNTHYYFYNSANRLSKIEVKAENGEWVDNIKITCLTTDEKGLCTLQQHINKKGLVTEIVFKPTY